MFNLVSKLFTGFFLPPGLFITLFVIIAFLSKKVRKIAIFSAILLYLISTKPIANLLLTPLETNLTIIQQKNDTKYTILLGGGFNFEDIFKFSPHAFKREVYAFMISKETNTPLIFCGAKKEMKAFLDDLRLFEKQFNFKITYYFPKPSLNTYQNAETASELFEKNGWKKKIYLITSAYHMKRAIMLYKHFGFEVIPKPVDFLRDYNYDYWDFLPNAGSFLKSYAAIHEYFGILSLKIRGI